MQNNSSSQDNPENPRQESANNGAQQSTDGFFPTSENFGNFSQPEYREYAIPGVPPEANTVPPVYGRPAEPTIQPAAFGAPVLPQNNPPGFGAPPYPYPYPYSMPGYGTPGAPPPLWSPPPQTQIPPPDRNARKRTLFVVLISGLLALILVLAIIFAIVPRLNPPVSTHTTTTPPTTIACSGATTPCSSSTPASQTGVPTTAFHSSTCAIPLGKGLVEGQQVRCGYVTVPEDRSNSNNGRTVTLPIIIFKSQMRTSTGPDPDPVLRLEGGPGGSSLDGWARYITADNYNDFIFQHDLIMFDQRGTGHSTPSLNCPELIALQYQAHTSDQQYDDAARVCHDRLTAQGINLNDYTSIENAADVSDIIHALGYQQMTIYGVSYGTRLALTVMRLYPSVVRSSILDSVYPPNHNRNDLPSDAQRVFTVLFQGCTKDPTCNTKYPQLQKVFYNLVDTLNASPIQFTTVDANTQNQYAVRFSGNDLISWVFSALYDTELIPLLPQTIFQIRDHDYGQLSTIYGLIEYDTTLSDGLFYSATCSEDWDYLTKQDITKSLQGITNQLGTVFGGDEQDEYNICQFWNVKATPAAQKQPVVSNLPTLVLSGEYDPITPPSNGKETASHLSHSYFFIFPGQGHGQEYSSPCSDMIISSFVDNPNQAPDSSCINQMAEPLFQ